MDKEPELEELRRFRDEVQRFTTSAVNYYTSKQHTNVTPKINLSGAKYILQLLEHFKLLKT